LDARGVRYVTFDEWEVIDQAEIERGRVRGAPRSKFVEIPQMIDTVEMKRRGW
jgi:ferredoxin--NADP+ reductase